RADRTMDQRRQAVEGFRGGKYRVLVATDIAARGLDIDGIHTVINYEVTNSTDTNVHRVERTGSSSEASHAYTPGAPEEPRGLDPAAAAPKSGSQIAPSTRPAGRPRRATRTTIGTK